jgi:hypothetical protein
LDSFLQIQFGSVYRGLTPLDNEEVLKIYKNRIIPIAIVEGDLRVRMAFHGVFIGRVFSRNICKNYLNKKKFKKLNFLAHCG